MHIKFGTEKGKNENRNVKERKTEKKKNADVTSHRPVASVKSVHCWDMSDASTRAEAFSHMTRANE